MVNELAVRPRLRRAIGRRLGVLTFLLAAGVGVRAEQYVSQTAFLERVFSDNVPGAATLWLNAEHKTVARNILQHDYNGLRVRYWRAGNTSVWLLKEIGKERPITIGVVIDGERIVEVEILEFLESRGWEVKYPSFKSQFEDARLVDDLELSRDIDGITGATLSVRAVTKIARLALYLNQQAAG